MTPTQEKTRRSLIGKTETRNEHQVQAVEALLEVIGEAQRAQQGVPHTPLGTDTTRFLSRPPAAMRTLVLKDTAVTYGKDGQVKVGQGFNSAGETRSIAEAIFQQSRFVQAGGNLEFWPHIEPQFINTGSTERTMGLVVQPKSFAVVNPADMALIGDDADVTVSDIPLFLSAIDRNNQKSYGVAFKLTRRQMKERGDEQTAAELLTGIYSGVARIVDKLALQAVLANTPEAFSLAKAAAAGVRVADLRGLVGTDATGASFRADGQLVAAGIPAELTPVTDQTVIGQFDRALAVVGPDMSVLVNRLNANGDVTVTAWLSVDAVAPDAGRFWVAA